MSLPIFHLIFSLKSLPFAELIFYHKFLSSKFKLKFGLSKNLLAQESMLLIPKSSFSEKKQKLKGKATILKFMQKLMKKDFYEEYLIYQAMADLKESKAIDNIADCLYIETKSDMKASTDEHVIFARTEIERCIDEIPALELFKFKIVEQVQPKIGEEDSLKIYNSLAPIKGEIGYGVNHRQLGISNYKELKFETNEYFTKIEPAQVFINFVFNKDKFFAKTLTQALKQGSNYGTNASGYGKFAICEFSSPNIAKPFHAGHLRSTIIGSFVQKALVANGWETTSINYLGDWGKQYGLLAVGFEKYGSESELERDPIKHLYDVYVKINSDASNDESIHDSARSYFKKMEDGDPAALALWKKFRDLSIVAYKKIYARINVHFDVYSGESQYSLDQMQGVLKQLKEMGLLTKLEGGALAVDLEPYNLGTAVIGKTDGSMLYLSRDIAAASDRFDQYEFDEMYYVVGTQQFHHFKQLFKILELQGKTWADRCHHIGFGLIKSKDGNMSTRKGTVVFLQDILDHVKEEMHQVMKKNETKYAQIQDPEYVSDIVGISSIIVQDLTAKRIKDYAFDWARMLSFEGDSGPYLQYAHARLCSIARGSSYTVDVNNVKDYLPLLKEPHALDLMDVISQYPTMVGNLPEALEPCAVVVYALRISHCVSAAYTDLWVHGAEKEVAIARLALYNAARVCLGNSLKLLGLIPLERM